MLHLGSIMSGALALWLLAGCAPTRPSGADPNNQTPAAVVGAQPSDSGSANDSNSPSGNSQTGSAGDTSGDAGQSSPGSDQKFTGCQFDLQGFWREPGSTETRYVAVDHVGPTVISTFLQPAVCDHRDGTGATSTTEDDWIGTISDCQITGTIQLCQFGCQSECTNGWVDSQSFSATVSSDGQQITGHWVGTDGSEGDVTLTRLSCQPRLPGDFGFQDTPDVHWVRDEVSVEMPPDPNVGLSIDLHPAGGQALTAATPLSAGFDGTVAETSPADATHVTNRVVVELSNGTEIAYDFKGQILVNSGDSVTAGTPVGQLEAGDGSGVLITPTDRHNSPANIDCVGTG